MQNDTHSDIVDDCAVLRMRTRDIRFRIIIGRIHDITEYPVNIQ